MGNYLFQVGNIVKTKTGKIKIIEQIRTPNGKNNTRKGYTYECIIDKNIGNISESDLKKGGGCPVCCHSPNKVLIGYNDIATTDKWMIEWLQNKEDAYKYTSGSGVVIPFKCKRCGNVKNMIINKFHRQGISCPKCSDGYSMPQKFTFNVLDQLHIKFETEKRDFKWLKEYNYRYDFYFKVNNNEYVVEVDGGQHFYKQSKNSNWNSLIHVQKADEEKEILAKNNGIYMIRIDCRMSDFSYMRENILQSKLSQIFDLSNIDWIQCCKYCQSSRVKEVCEMYNSGTGNAVDITKSTKLHYDTVRDYLKRGTILGWCDYDGRKEKGRLSARNGMLSAKRVVCLETKDVFPSAKECERQSKEKFSVRISQGSISKACNKKTKAKGYSFRYLDEIQKEELIKYELLDIV